MSSLLEEYEDYRGGRAKKSKLKNTRVSLKIPKSSSSNSSNKNQFFYNGIPKPAVFKIIKNIDKTTGKPNRNVGYSLMKSFDYLARDTDELNEEQIKQYLEKEEQSDILNSIHLETDDGRILTTKKERYEYYKEWSETFTQRKDGKDFEHVIFSTLEKPGTFNEEILDAARSTLANKYGSQGYNYAFVLHEDTEHTHVHAIMRVYNTKTQKRLDIKKDDIWETKLDFAKELKNRGLDYEANIQFEKIKGFDNKIDFLKSQDLTWFESHVEKLKDTDIDKLLETIKDIDKQLEQELPKREAPLNYDEKKELNKNIQELYTQKRTIIYKLNTLEYDLQQATKDYESLNSKKEQFGWHLKATQRYKDIDKKTNEAYELLLQKKIEVDKAQLYLNETKTPLNFSDEVKKDVLEYISDNINQTDDFQGTLHHLNQINTKLSNSNLSKDIEKLKEKYLYNEEYYQYSETFKAKLINDIDTSKISKKIKKEYIDKIKQDILIYDFELNQLGLSKYNYAYMKRLSANDKELNYIDYTASYISQHNKTTGNDFITLLNTIKYQNYLKGQEFQNDFLINYTNSLNNKIDDVIKRVETGKDIYSKQLESIGLDTTNITTETKIFQTDFIPNTQNNIQTFQQYKEFLNEESFNRLEDRLRLDKLSLKELHNELEKSSINSLDLKYKLEIEKRDISLEMITPDSMQEYLSNDKNLLAKETILTSIEKNPGLIKFLSKNLENELNIKVNNIESLEKNLNRLGEKSELRKVIDNEIHNKIYDFRVKNDLLDDHTFQEYLKSLENSDRKNRNAQQKELLGLISFLKKNDSLAPIFESDLRKIDLNNVEFQDMQPTTIKIDVIPIEKNKIEDIDSLFSTLEKNIQDKKNQFNLNENDENNIKQIEQQYSKAPKANLKKELNDFLSNNAHDKEKSAQYISLVLESKTYSGMQYMIQKEKIKDIPKSFFEARGVEIENLVIEKQDKEINTIKMSSKNNLKTLKGHIKSSSINQNRIYEQYANIDYKKELENIKDIDFNALSFSENIDKFALLDTIRQKAIENKDLEILDITYKNDEIINHAHTLKEYGKVLNININEIKKDIWLIDMNGSLDEYKGFGENQIKNLENYKEVFIEKYLDKLSIEYLLKKAEIEPQSIEDSIALENDINNFNKAIETYRQELQIEKEDKLYQDQLQEIKNQIESGNFYSADLQIESMQFKNEFDKKNLEIFYSKVIDMYANEEILSNIDKELNISSQKEYNNYLTYYDLELSNKTTKPKIQLHKEEQQQSNEPIPSVQEIKTSQINSIEDINKSEPKPKIQLHQEEHQQSKEAEQNSINKAIKEQSNIIFNKNKPTALNPQQLKSIEINPKIDDKPLNTNFKVAFSKFKEDIKVLIETSLEQQKSKAKEDQYFSLSKTLANEMKRTLTQTEHTQRMLNNIDKKHTTEKDILETNLKEYKSKLSNLNDSFFNYLEAINKSTLSNENKIDVKLGLYEELNKYSYTTRAFKIIPEQKETFIKQDLNYMNIVNNKLKTNQDKTLHKELLNKVDKKLETFKKLDPTFMQKRNMKKAHEQLQTIRKGLQR